MKRGDLVRLTGTSKIGLVLDVLETRVERRYHNDRTKTCGIWWTHRQEKGRAWMHALELVTPQGDCEKKIS